MSDEIFCSVHGRGASACRACYDRLHASFSAQLKRADALEAALKKIAEDDLDIAGDSYEGHFYEHKEIAANALKETGR